MKRLVIVFTLRFLALSGVFLLVVLGIAVRLNNPTMTETQLFMAYAPEFIGVGFLSLRIWELSERLRKKL